MFDKSSSSVWLSYADNSYIATRLLWFTGFLIETPVNSHRTIELYIKAFLVGNGIQVKMGSPAWGHKLSDLYKSAVEIDPSIESKDVYRRVKFFERYFDFVRYPSDKVCPDDGSLTWFSFDSNIAPLDELVAFIRPRVSLDLTDWSKTNICNLLADEENAQPHQLRALKDGNNFIDTINTNITTSPHVVFDCDFNFDEAGC
ncbi:HEPN domain-containing protein [Dasania marina]|uniref:HEPN domain-containing protein n=1 Tax=Dasania marina TaxID=471499 RepID=UPI00037F551E|nr:HEPN domain-containing protein [Dasania marina]